MNKKPKIMWAVLNAKGSIVEVFSTKVGAMGRYGGMEGAQFVKVTVVISKS